VKVCTTHHDENLAQQMTIYQLHIVFFLSICVCVCCLRLYMCYFDKINNTCMLQCEQTLKKVMVEPPLIVPYLISVCLARSSADSIGDLMRSVVKNDVKLAVYDEMIISVKNHHIPLTIRVDAARGPISQPGHILTSLYFFSFSHLFRP